jgi:hemerythrin superfamily protein
VRYHLADVGEPTLEEAHMDAITLLKSDHRSVKRLFRTFEQVGERAKSTRSKTASAIVRELSRHAAIEEQVFYPAVRQAIPDLSDEVLESLEEHHVVKWLCSEVERSSPDDERFTARVTVLIENVRHHIREEEETLFPAVRQALGRKRLAELGELLEEAKRRAPTHPHPRLPSTPPANLAAGVIAGAVDKARDVGEKAVTQARRKAG